MNTSSPGAQNDPAALGPRNTPASRVNSSTPSHTADHSLGALWPPVWLPPTPPSGYKTELSVVAGGFVIEAE